MPLNAASYDSQAVLSAISDAPLKILLVAEGQFWSPSSLRMFLTASHRLASLLPILMSITTAASEVRAESSWKTTLAISRGCERTSRLALLISPS